MRNYGDILNEVLDAIPTKLPHLRKIALKATSHEPANRYRDVQDLKLAIEKRSSNQLYIFIIIFLVVMLAILAWLNSSYRPAHPAEESTTIELMK